MKKTFLEYKGSACGSTPRNVAAVHDFIHYNVHSVSETSVIWTLYIRTIATVNCSFYGGVLILEGLCVYMSNGAQAVYGVLGLLK